MHIVCQELINHLYFNVDIFILWGLTFPFYFYYSLAVVIFYFFCKQPFYIERKGMDGWPKERETYCRRVLVFFGGLRQGLKKKRKEKSLNNT